MNRRVVTFGAGGKAAEAKPKKVRIPRAPSALEERFWFFCLAEARDGRLPLPRREFMFHDTRKWRFDFAWPDRLVAVECEGAIWSGGRHTRGAGVEADCEKVSEAGGCGWIVLRVSKRHIDSGRAIEWARLAYNSRGQIHAA